jgi:hypothetical protein
VREYWQEMLDIAIIILAITVGDVVKTITLEEVYYIPTLVPNDKRYRLDDTLIAVGTKIIRMSVSD